VGTVAVLLPIVAMNADLLTPLFKKDPFAVAALGVDAGWAYWRTVAGFWALVGGIFVYWQSAKPLTKRILGMHYVVVAVFVQLALMVLIKPIEKHSQHSLIATLKAMHRQEPFTWVAPDGFKSYAHLFYNSSTAHRACLKADSSFYNHTGARVLFTKIHKASRFIDVHHAEIIESKGGYVFLRLPQAGQKVD
jgi:hypothetical protein